MRINTVRLRAMLGWLGMLLPWIVVLLIGYIPASISATWYTNASTVFMIILGSASILLMCYKGYDLLDDLTLTLAGVAGLGVCLFPTYISGEVQNVGTFMIPKDISSNIHNICAFVFFGLLSYNSLFLFTKGDGHPTKKKKIRNIIYIVSGIGMMASFLLLLLPYFHIQVWLVETIALSFFGISFLTKADIYPWLFCDTAYTDEEVKYD